MTDTRKKPGAGFASRPKAERRALARQGGWAAQRAGKGVPFAGDRAREMALRGVRVRQAKAAAKREPAA